MQSILSSENCEMQRDIMKDDDNLENPNTPALSRKGCKTVCHEEEVSGCSDENAGVQGSKEKTPMCLVNDLARFNKISFQYRLTGEKGPAHCKQFTVTLELGDEVYTSEGFKIKKAQHLAAKEAIQRTKYKHPVPKVSRRIDEQGGCTRPNVTPTVELNALAMKLGQQTYYIFDPRQMGGAENHIPAFDPLAPPRYRVRPPLGNNGQIRPMILTEQRHFQNNHNYSGTFVPNLATNPGAIRVHQESHYRAKYQNCYQIEPTSQNFISAPLPACRITLIVGTHKFYGVGRTIQQAKHDAASQAIIKLKEEMACERNDAVVEKSDESDHKSPISLVFEIGIKRNLTVDFKILREDGPAHMRKFITACIVGDIVTEGEGTGKKASKKKAAQKMIEQLSKLPPLSPVNVPTKRIKTKAPTRKSLTSPTKNKIVTQTQGQHYPEKSQKSETDTDNPVAKMIEWCKENEFPEPEFKTLAEKGKDRSRRGQFVVEVTTNDHLAQGCGNSKKTAKRNAAQNFLLSVSSKMSTTSEEVRTKRVRFPDECNILDNQNLDSTSEKVHVEGTSNIIGKTKIKATINNGTLPPNAGQSQITESQQTELQTNGSNTMVQHSVSTVASETQNVGGVEKSSSVPMPAESGSKPNTMSSTKPKAKSFHMKDKLLYLAKLIGFEVDFSDYPKGNHNEFLTILMISTNPPQICHGVGINSEESQEDAAKNALKILSEMGLNSSMK